MKRNGFSLVELMVALLLGSLISLAATQLFLVNRQADNLQEGLAAVQDQGRFIVDYMSRDLMQAGHDPLAAIEPFTFVGDAGKISTDGTRYDTLVLNVNDGVNCMGADHFSGIKKYHVNNKKNLICAEYEDVAGVLTAKNSESLIDNVEAFQVLYGIDFDELGATGYGQADVYTTASKAAAATWRVVSVRFSVLLSSDRNVGFDSALAPNSIAMLDETIDNSDGVNLADGRLYRVYTSTVGLRNQIELE